MNKKIAIAKLGEGQLVDVRRSGREVFDRHFRTCTVLQGEPPTSDIGDTTPHRMAKLYGHDWKHWNRHFIIQAAGCPLACWYCYVDNFKPDKFVDVSDLVEAFGRFKSEVPDLNVLHLMGGDPGIYCEEWPALRAEMDRQGFEDVLMLTNVVLVEDSCYGRKPWLHIPERCLVNVCLKGTNCENFLRNTGRDWFERAQEELLSYLGRSDCFFQLIEWDEEDADLVRDVLGEENIDWLRVKEYEVVRRRREVGEAPSE